MLDFSAMYTSTMHAALLMLTRNYTETLGTLGLELAATSCHIYMALQLMLLIAEYMQLVKITSGLSNYWTARKLF